jgi:pyruvate dehydrogenase E2 component (dihydrolipoamide acetyltransferase)
MAINVIMPRQGQSVESCIIGELYKKKGDHVKEGETILSYETDKAAFDLDSPVSGVILEILCKTGDEVAVLSNVAIIGEPGEAINESISKETSLSTVGASSTSAASDGQVKGRQKNGEQVTTTDGTERVKISPRARNLASILNLDISRVKGTGPMGKILEKDIQDVAAALQATSGGGIGKSEPTSEKAPATNEYTIKKISNVRRIIAENMHSSLRNSAQLTHHTSANVKKMLQYRERLKSDPGKAKGENITINDMVCYSVIKALNTKPEINSHFLGDTIKSFHQTHLGIAVDTERGLMVPALKNAGDYSLAELSRELKTLADRCKNGNIDLDLLAADAASFTVSNLGIYGVEMFTPVLNLPQTGILGVNTIVYRLEQLADGKIASVPFIGLSLTYDHRAIDGVPASLFLKEVKNQIEMFDVDGN